MATKIEMVYFKVLRKLNGIYVNDKLLAYSHCRWCLVEFHRNISILEFDIDRHDWYCSNNCEHNADVNSHHCGWCEEGSVNHRDADFCDLYCANKKLNCKCQWCGGVSQYCKKDFQYCDPYCELAHKNQKKGKCIWCFTKGITIAEKYCSANCNESHVNSICGKCKAKPRANKKAKYCSKWLDFN